MTSRDAAVTTGSDPEAVRLAALDRYDILDTPAEPGFDDIVDLAAQICETPVSLVSLVDKDRQWFKARHGFAPCETDLSQSVCAHALAEDEILVIPDLATDPRTAANPLVTGQHHLRFYAGAVLRTPDGVAVGSLCVIDTEPRPAGLLPKQRHALLALARQVMTQLELRRAVAERDAAIRQGRSAEAMLHRDVARHDALLALRGTIGRAAGDLDAILGAVVDAAPRVIPAAEGAVVEMRDGSDLVYRATSGRMLPFLGQRIAMADSLSGLSLRQGRTLETGDAEADVRIDPALARTLGIRSMVVVPVARLGEFVGVLKVQSHEPQAFTPQDVRSAELLAAAAAAGFGDVAETRSLRELEASERMLRRAQEAGQIGTFSTDIARRITTASDQFFRLFGLDPTGEAPTAVFEALVHEDDRAGTTSDTRRKAGLDATSVEYRIRRADTGEMRWIARNADYVRDAAGRLVSLIGTAQDVTQRRRDQARRDLLLDLDDRFKELADPDDIMAILVEALGRALSVMRVGYAELDAGGTTAAVLRRWSRAGEPLARSGPVRLDDYGPELIAELRAGRSLAVDDLRAEPRAGPAAVAAHAAIGCVATLAVPILEGGRMTAFVYAHHDVPRRWDAHDLQLVSDAASRTWDALDRARAEVALRRSEARLLLAQDVGGIGTFEVQLDSDELEASPEMFRLFGLPERQRCSTAYFTDLVLEEDRQTVYTPELRRSLTTPTTSEYRIHRADDGALRWIRRVARRLEGRGMQPRLIGVLQDITDRKATELALTAARDAAESANRAKSNFLANMSHELRTPLSAVIGYSEMMEEDVEDLGHPGLRDDLGKIKSNARHLLGLINDVLDLSKIEAGHMDVFAEEVDVAALVRDVAATVETLVRRKSNTLVLRIAEDAGTMRSDGLKIRQSLLNLLGNASKFTDAGTITLGVEREGGDLVFRISDTGIGMTAEQLSRLFQRFSQADETTTRKFGGTGLGLALTRAFADLLGGTVAVDSAVGQGTTFTLRLPAVLPRRPGPR